MCVNSHSRKKVGTLENREEDWMECRVRAKVRLYGMERKVGARLCGCGLLGYDKKIGIMNMKLILMRRFEPER